MIPSSRSLLRLTIVAAASLACLQPAQAGKFSKFKGTYSGTAKISGTGITYSTEATTKVSTPSNGKQAKFKLQAAQDSQSFYLQLKLNDSGACTFVCEVNGKLTVNASGSYVRQSGKKVTFAVSTVISGVTFSASGKIVRSGDATLKIDGTLVTSQPIAGVPSSIGYSFKGSAR